VCAALDRQCSLNNQASERIAKGMVGAKNKQRNDDEQAEELAPLT
jgi:hypothetical protein